MKWLRQEIRTLAISLTIHRRHQKPARKADNPAEVQAAAAKGLALARVQAAILLTTGKKPLKPAKKAGRAAAAIATAE